MSLAQVYQLSASQCGGGSNMGGLIVLKVRQIGDFLIPGLCYIQITMSALISLVCGNRLSRCEKQSRKYSSTILVE